MVNMKDISEPAVGARGFQSDRFCVALNLCNEYKTQPLLLNVKSFPHIRKQCCKCLLKILKNT